MTTVRSFLRCGPLFLALAGLLGSGPAARAQENLPPGAEVVRVEALPAAVVLKLPFDYRQLLFVGHLDNGDRVDVTRLARLEAPDTLLRATPTGLLRPVADGSGELKCVVGDQS